MDYTVKGAATATGVTPSRLRTWERRFGIPKPKRAATGRRLYDEDDLRVIRRMAGLVAAGVPAAQAAAAALAAAEASESEKPPSAAENVADPIVGTMLSAAQRYDEATLSAAIDRAVSREGWEVAGERVLFPVLRELGARWESGAIMSAVEHFASALIRREVEAALAAEPPA